MAKIFIHKDVDFYFLQELGLREDWKEDTSKIIIHLKRYSILYCRTDGMKIQPRKTTNLHKGVKWTPFLGRRFQDRINKEIHSQ
uniref:Uncharacterized protein n=1 Tax=Lepeophtheirus salmonis TaxID=72036 RepID=A0A0K2UAD7_LEPSM